MLIFNRNYQLPQTQESLQQIARMKKAADRVYQYFNWLESDYRKADNTDKHRKQIENLIDDVRITLFFNERQQQLASYFTACVMFSIYNSFMEDSPSGTSFPISRTTFDQMYDAQAVSEMLCTAPSSFVGLCVGSLVLDDTVDPATTSTIELARKGALVMADQELVDTVALATLTNIDDHDDLDASEEGQLFLDELRRISGEITQVMASVTS